jgi:predicted nucleotidyltransferase
MTPELEKIISTLKLKKEYLHEKYGVSKLGIFGSYTRNDFTENSDVDLMVDFDRKIGMEFISLADELEKILNKKVDLVTEGSVNRHVFPYVQKDLLYV